MFTKGSHLCVILKDLMRSLSCATLLYLQEILISYPLFTEPQCTSRLLIDWFQCMNAELMFSVWEQPCLFASCPCIDHSRASTPVKQRHFRMISFIHYCRYMHTYTWLTYGESQHFINACVFVKENDHT